MKIINNDECYVQGYDLDHVLHTDNKFPLDMYLGISGSKGYVSDLSKYYKIENPRHIEYISKCGLIVDYNELVDKDVDVLACMVKSFKKFIEDWDNVSEYNDVSELQNNYQAIQQMDYVILQIKEMIKLKTGKSDIIYPDIPNPVEIPITNGIYCASRSINYDNVLIYRLDSKDMDDMVDESFIKYACSYFINEFPNSIEEDEKEEFRKLSDDLKYFIIGQKTKECSKGKYSLSKTKKNR